MENDTTLDPFNNDDDGVYLEWLNEKFAATKLGGVIFVGVLMVIGIIGNLHVLYIYATKFKRSTHRIYILCLAMVDTVTCCIGMPFVIVDLQNPLLFRAIAVCKILRFLNYFMCSSSAILLVVIAVDRYKNICHPFEVQMTEQRAKIACGISLMIGLILSWPAPILYGASTVETKAISLYLHMEIKANMTGTQCFTVDRFFGTPYQTIFNVVLIGIILILTTVLAVLYSLICRAVIQQARNFNKMTKSINNGLKTTTGPIYKNEIPKVSSEHTSSSADSRSTVSEGVSDTQKENRNMNKIHGDSHHEGVKQNVQNYNCDFNEGVKQNDSNDQNFVKCIFVLNVDEVVIDGHVMNNNVYQNLTGTDNDERTVSQEYQNVYSENETNDSLKDNKSVILKENEACEIQQENLLEADIVNRTIETDLSNDEVVDWNQGSVEDNTYKNDIVINNPQKSNDNQGTVAYENIELGTCGQTKDTITQNTYENIEVKENNSHKNALCGEENFAATEINGEQQSAQRMDLVENTLAKETKTKHQSFDVLVTNNGVEGYFKPCDKNTYMNVKPDMTKQPKTKKAYNRERQAKRITLMLFIITLVFVLSFIPHLTLKILAFVRKDFLTNLSYTQLLLYHTFVWSFFINNMANPIIYGFCDSVFRKEIKKTYKYCFQKCKSCVKFRSYSFS